jgi:Ser/Thr protein kinase RdoA (MazF antagonist)
MISSELLSTIESRYDINLIGEPEVLTGGWWNQVFRLPTDFGAVVMRVFHRRTKPQNVVYQHALMRFLAQSLTEVHAPLVARDDSTFFRHDDRLVCLLPFVSGEAASRESATDRDGAAQLLASLHQAALHFPANVSPPDYAPMSEFNWTSNDWWNWLEIREVLEKGVDELIGLLPENGEQSSLAAREIVNRRTQIDEERRNFQTRIAEIKFARPLLTAPTHGDFYAGNVLVDGAGGRISAVIDWDDAHPDWLVYELARATWEFCRSKKEKTLDENRAFDFMRNYTEAEGVVSPVDFDLLIELMCAVRLQEVLFALAETISGEFSDLEYTLFNLLSLENLRGIKLTL